MAILLLLTWYTWWFLQAGIVESLDALVKEFVAASNEEKKAVFARIQEEAEKLTGSSARYSMGVSLWLSGFYILLGFKKHHPTPPPPPPHAPKKKKKEKKGKQKVLLVGILFVNIIDYIKCLSFINSSPIVWVVSNQKINFKSFQLELGNF